MKLSVIVVCYNMARELPRTIRSLSPVMQQGIGRDDYEIIVVDNGSTHAPDLSSDMDDMRLRIMAVPPAEVLPSPARAVNAAIREAQGALIGVMIDGARMASPGLLATALRADGLDERAVILTLGFHLGPKVQMQSVLEGYDAEEEDRLLESISWREDGYRLFDISVFAGSSSGGWFKAISESNALFMRKQLWDELGGFDERFNAPGGGVVNLDLLSRAIALPQVQVVTLLGEGTFHQVHGGAATNASVPVEHVFMQEYERVRGLPYQHPSYDSLYLGRIPDAAHGFVEGSLQRPAAPLLVSRPSSDRCSGEIASCPTREDRPAGAPPQALVVLGMHRSGTSALAGVLCKLGFALPGTPIARRPDNPKGHFESEWVHNLNERILRRLGTNWDDPLPSCFDWKAMRIEDLLSVLDRRLTEAFAANPFLLVKDPRLCLLAPIWSEAFARAKRDVAYVISARHPVEVALSLQARDGLAPASALAVWLKYVLAAERATRGTRRCVITYPQLLQDCPRTLAAIQTRLDLKWPVDTEAVRAEIATFLDRELYHHAGAAVPADAAIASLCEAVWDLMQDLAADPEDPDAMRKLDDIARRYEDAAALMSSLFAVRKAPIEAAPAPQLDGLRLRVPHQPEVWLVFHGLRHHVSTSRVYDAFFDTTTDLRTMPTVEHITRGPDLVDGAGLIRGAGYPDIYLLNGNARDGVRKHRIRSFAAFKTFGFSLDKVRELPAIVVDGILEGRTIG